jgi:hypothetical protein
MIDDSVRAPTNTWILHEIVCKRSTASKLKLCASVVFVSYRRDLMVSNRF